MPLAFQNMFAGSLLDRAGNRRNDRDWLSLQLQASDAVTVTVCKGKLLATQTGLVRRPVAEAGLPEVDSEGLLFLGLQGAVPVFAVDLAEEASAGVPADTGAFEELRALAPLLSADEASQAAAARSLFEWHRRHRWCSNCGNPTRSEGGGWKRVCPACQSEHYPRTDPVVIMLPTYQDTCLVGRQAAWEPGRWSALAGFVEPGESLEEAVARELFEEAAVTAIAMRYHSSQPWPFPGQLMVGFIVELDGDRAQADTTELEALRWFTRREAGLLVRGEFDGASAPPPLAIAHQLLKAWAEGV